MHAVVVRATVHDVEGARAHLRDNVVPRVSQAPGFVAGYWVRFDGDAGTAVIVFDSEEAAQAAAQTIAPPPSGAATIDSVNVGEVVEHA